MRASFCAVETGLASFCSPSPGAHLHERGHGQGLALQGSGKGRAGPNPLNVGRRIRQRVHGNAQACRRMAGVAGHDVGAGEVPCQVSLAFQAPFYRLQALR